MVFMKKSLFLKQSFMFSKVYKHGKYKAGDIITVYVLKNYRKTEKTKLGISVSAKNGGAVSRNRVKRIVREAYYKFAGRLYDGNIIVVLARKPCYDRKVKTQDVYIVMEKLFRQMGILKPAPSDIPAGGNVI